MPFPSTTLKLVGVSILALAMGVPLLFVAGLVGERQGRLAAAEAAIAEAQGRAQVLSPPLLAWEEELRSGKPERVRRVTHRLAARDAELRATLAVEERRRGIFRVPVYQVDASITGRFEPDARVRDRARMIPGTLRLEWPIEDLRGVREIGAVTLGGRRMNPEAAASAMPGGEGLVVALAEHDMLPERLDYTLPFKVSGTRELWFRPLAQTTTVEVEAAWGAPSFAGAFLPVEREVMRDGFTARWSVLGVNRRIPAAWSEFEQDAIPLDATRFGVVLHDPVTVYRLVERSLKYGLLFVGLTFGLSFVVEVLSGRRVHPVQYLLVGAALVVFYLVLLALAEHVGFGPAWLGSAVALVVIVGGYAASTLGDGRRGAMVGGWLAMLYGFLWVMVTSEDHALLIGAIGVLAMLAGTMWLTRRVDWYRVDSPSPASPKVALGDA
jgi:inner membrane protein